MAVKYLNDGLMTLLKKDTAGVIIYQVGTDEAQVILASKNGGNFGAVNAGTTAAKITGGDSAVLYALTINAADTATLGPILFESKGATDTTYVWGMVVAELPGSLKAGAIAAATFAAEAIDANAMKADANTEIATATAALILATPAQKLVTNASGQVEVGALAANVLTAAATHADFGAEIAAAVADKDLVTYEATGDTGTRLGDMIAAARAELAGAMTVSGVTVTVYEVDGVTAMGTHTLDSATLPRQRTGLA